jgi:hypothetical protein
MIRPRMKANAIQTASIKGGISIGWYYCGSF